MRNAGAVERLRALMLRALARQGLVEGRNLVLEVRTGAAAELPALAEELLATKPDAVLANGSVAIAAVREHSNTVPIVGAAIGGDPVAAGFAVSLARPGGNVTGSLMLAPETRCKAPGASPPSSADRAAYSRVGDQWQPGRTLPR